MDALVLVDIQNDFMPTGALPVPRGDEVVSVANLLIKRFAPLVIATQDWHPKGHMSFASAHPGRRPGEVVETKGVAQVLWPDHCVQQTPGASFHSGLDVAGISHVIRKGTDPAVDSYSGFFDNDKNSSTGLDVLLKRHRATRVILAGLATDYCVLFTALYARRLGYTVIVVRDGCRAVKVSPGDEGEAWERMKKAGCHVLFASDMN